MSEKCFIDTNILIGYSDDVFSNYKQVSIHMVTLEELDNIIHNSENESKKYYARQAIKVIEKYLKAGKIEVISKTPSFKIPNGMDESKKDNIILATAKDLSLSDFDTIFLTDDLNLLLKAKALNIECSKYKEDEITEIYTGYTSIEMSEEEMARFYESGDVNISLNENEYLFIKDFNGNIIDKHKYSNGKLNNVPNKAFKSIYFDDFKPRDLYQLCAMDSLINNDLTLLYGSAGSGKTTIALSYLMQQISMGKIDKIVVVFNPAKLKNNEHLGFYSGDRTQKLLQNSIGGILTSKFGSVIAVETLISQGKLILIPTSDIRGIEIAKNDALFVTEAQNVDDYTMRTIIQRAAEGCKVIIEGDILEQRDIKIGLNKSGMYRILDVFKNEKEFGCMKLENIYRSRLAELAQKI